MKTKLILYIFFIIFISIGANKILDIFYTPINSSYMEDIISNLTSIIEGYVYLDIAKNPPNSLHEKVNLKEELNKINTTNDRPFYDFFRDIRKVFAKLKDIHLIPNSFFNSFSTFKACIPISFYINIDNNNEYQLYIKNNFICPFKYENEKISTFINKAINDKVEISSINNVDPFDFIQNFGKEFLELKNEHAHFTAMMQNISYFYLYLFPLNESELTLTIKLSNGEEENITYFIFSLPEEQIKFNVIKNGKLDWNYSLNGFKCRVDEVNKFNVFYQNTFLFENTTKIKEIIYNCSELFHKNEYNIIGIESRNIGENSIIGIYLEQLLQPKICTNKMLFSMRKNEFLIDNFYNFQNNYLDFRTCKEPNFENFFLNKSDIYSDEITHNRTIILDAISLDTKKDLYSKREKLINIKKTKKPTEIIIFTDYQSISATSIFIKGFQQSGGAITVGYFGNPKNNITISDSSISSSGIISYNWTKYFQNLINLEFQMLITGQEFYDFDFQKENPIPQEYISIPVDEHVDIYEDYSDDNYDKFINASKIIFEKYNNQCNINNKRLLLEDDNCYNISNHTHGGYPCGDDGYWNKNICQPFYCDLGYYYDTYQKKCIEDICNKMEDNKNDDELISFWAICIIVGGGILVLLISLLLIRRTVHNKKSNNEIEITEEAKLMD